MRPIAIDLFAGAGGLSLGFEQAGFDVAAAVEIDPVHAAVHSFNFPNCKVIAKSVKDLSGNEIRSLADIGTRKVDVVFGGAPCQGFSLIGQRALDDPRNELVRDFVRLVHEVDANYFVFENVKGITVGKHKAFLNELIELFSEKGYKTLLPWKVLNASDYGVPQDRQRLFLMGCKKQLVLPTYPLPTHARNAGGRLKKTPNCSDALADVPDADQYDELINSDAVRAEWGIPSEYAARLRGLIDDPTDFSSPRAWDRNVLTSSARTSHSPISKRRFEAAPQGSVEPISRFFKLPADGVSNTLRAGTDSARGAFTSPRPIHYKHNRCITVREMARLHGFPDWFRFHVTKWHGARQIGNAVPPPLGRAVAQQIMSAVGLKPTKSNEKVVLHSTHLLSMDMGQAARYFGIANPISGRNRKGTPKRKQWDDYATAAE